jgi:hypothetical protein
MWGAAQVTALKAHSGIHPLKKNFHLLAVLPAEQAFPPEFKQTSPSRHVFKCVMTSGLNVIVA